MSLQNTKKKEEVDLASEQPLVVLPMSKIVFYVSIIWLLYFIDFVARFGVNPLYPLIQKEFALSDPQVGLLGSVVLFGMAIFVLPLSYIADRWSRSKLVSLMALVWSACSIASGLASNFVILLCARCGLGVGEASFAPTATSLLTSWFKRAK
jgi:MFS family permease